MSNEPIINIDTFKTVTKAIAKSDNLDMMTNHLARLLVTSLGIKGCSIFILNQEIRELEILASFGLSPRYLSKGPIRSEESIGQSLIKGEPVILSDVSKDDTVQYPEEAKEEGISAILSIPILFINEVLGAMRLYHHSVWELSEQDLDSLNLLAENIGLAMAYYRLLNAVQAIAETISMAAPTDLLNTLQNRTYE